MKKTNIFMIAIITLALLFFSFSTSVQCASLYRCVNSRGSIMLTDNIPTNPDYKCALAASYRDPSPQERTQEQRETQRKTTQQEYQRKAQGDKQEYENQVKQEYDAQKKKKADLEKNYLEDRRKALTSGSSNKFARDVNEEMDKRKEQLEKDPEQYFYDKAQREKAAAARPKSGSFIDPRTGNVIQGIPIH